MLPILDYFISLSRALADVPETRVRLGSSLDPNSIHEGMDLYFDCIVNAHPVAYKVEWRHNVSI